MPDSENPQVLMRRLDMVERNVSDHAKSLTALVHDVSELRTKNAVDDERERSRDEWRSRTEKRLDGIYRLGWWVLTTFGAILVAMVAQFVFRGGLVVPG